MSSESQSNDSKAKAEEKGQKEEVSASASTTATVIHGKCFCGKVELEFDTQGAFYCHCHCTLCQRLSGAEYLSLVGTREPANVRVVRGADALVSVASSEHMQRRFCGTCGSPMLNTANDNSLADAPMAVFARDADGRLLHQPRNAIHIFYRNRVRNHVDALPKFAALPGPDVKPLTVDENGEFVE